MPLLTKRRVLAAKIEATIGTAIALTSGTDGIINAYDVQLDPDIPFNKRMAAGAFGRQAGVVGAYGGGVKFKIEAVGSGTAGTAPAWANVLLPACGMTNAGGGLFSPISAFSGQNSITIANLEDGAKKFLAGAMGSWTFDGEDGKVGTFTFDFKGVWQPVVDAGMFTPQFSSIIPPRFAGATLTIGSYTPTCSKFSLKYGTVIDLRQTVTPAAGYISAVVTDRETTGTLDPEMTLVASYDAYGIWLAGTTAALTMTIGSGGTGFTISGPELQYTGPKEGNRNGIVTTDLPFQLCQNGSTVDSEVSIQF